MYDQVHQERQDLRFIRDEVLMQPHTVEMDEPYVLIHRGALSVHGTVVQAAFVPPCLEELGLLTSGRVRHTRLPSWQREMADNSHRAKLPENLSNIRLSGQNGQIINGLAARLRGPETKYDLGLSLRAGRQGWTSAVTA